MDPKNRYSSAGEWYEVDLSCALNIKVLRDQQEETNLYFQLVPTRSEPKEAEGYVHKSKLGSAGWAWS